MLVSDYFKRLSYGRFSNLSLSEDAAGTIAEASKNRVIGYMNDSLVRIYTRFNLKEREVLIRQYRHITNYHLDKRFAVNNPDRPSANKPYILDLPAEPFADDALKIVQVYDEYGRELPLNDGDSCLSVFTPYPTTLQIKDPQDERPLSIRYQASHEKLEFGVFTSEIELPLVLEGAFISLIAHYLYSDMNTEGSTAKAQEHLMTYETLCADIEKSGSADIGAPNTGVKFEKRGFV